jgi:hypothetical protein
VADKKFKTGAVRSADTNHLDYTSIPMVGLIGVARTAAEGGDKYGRFNYMLGMPVHELLNHSINHVVQFLLGDRTQPHLEHAAWGLLAAIQEHTLNPSKSYKYLLREGATVGPEMLKDLMVNAPLLASMREEGMFDESGFWNIGDIPEVARMLDQRFIKSVTSSVIDPDRLSEIEKLVLAESQNGEEQSQ